MSFMIVYKGMIELWKLLRAHKGYLTLDWEEQVPGAVLQAILLRSPVQVLHISDLASYRADV